MTQPTKRSNFRAAFTPCLLTIIVAFVATPVQAQDAITIGFTASKTGALSEQSLAQVRGFELWRDEVNAAGGIKAGPKRIKVEFKSTDGVEKYKNRRGVEVLNPRLIVSRAETWWDAWKQFFF